MLYDAFELQKMGECRDGAPAGGTFCEPIFSDEDILEDDEEALRIFWVIQGHLPTGGVETLTEHETLKKAGELHDFLWTLLDSHTKLQSIKAELEI